MVLTYYTVRPDHDVGRDEALPVMWQLCDLFTEGFLDDAALFTVHPHDEGREIMFRMDYNDARLLVRMPALMRADVDSRITILLTTRRDDLEDLLDLVTDWLQMTGWRLQ